MLNTHALIEYTSDGDTEVIVRFISNQSTNNLHF